jgi:aspartate/methionine/tyrosine aminotransferase
MRASIGRRPGVRRYSTLTDRIRDEGAGAWALHAEATRARARGEDVIVLSVGDPDLATPTPIVDRAVSALRGGDTHYTEIAGRPALRAALAERFAARSGVAVAAVKVMGFAGAQNAL